MKTTEPEPKILGNSKQKQVEKQQRARALEGKKLKGQQTLTGAICTSHRLSEFEEVTPDTSNLVITHDKLKLTDANGGV